MSDHKTALLAAMSAPEAERPAAVADALLGLLEDAGLTVAEAEAVLASVGHKRPRLHLVTLYQSVAWAQQMDRARGIPDRRGRLTELYAHFADVWADHTGRPYTPEDFKSAYRRWVRQTGGGTDRRARAGHERARK